MPAWMNINPFLTLSESISAFSMQVFLIVMVVLVIGGTVLDMIHKKNVKYFFNNAKKLKEVSKRKVGAVEAATIVTKTVAHDVLTSAEFCGWTRRLTHLLGMYGTIIFWVTSFILVFCHATTTSPQAPTILSQLWHIGALMTCVGGFWYWLFQRANVRVGGNPWYQIVFADLFILSLVATTTFGLVWSYFQTMQMTILSNLFLVLFILSNIILFGGVYWSKFAHMFYKPGAAIQKNLAKADGSRDHLPAPADKPAEFGLGIKREAPRHY